MSDPSGFGDRFHAASSDESEPDFRADSDGLLRLQQEVNGAPRPAASRRRERVEPNIYGRTAADGRQVFEVGYRDSTGRQRWRTVEGGIMAARAGRHDL